MILYVGRSSAEYYMVKVQILSKHEAHYSLVLFMETTQVKLINAL